MIYITCNINILNVIIKEIKDILSLQLITIRTGFYTCSLRKVPISELYIYLRGLFIISDTRTIEAVYVYGDSGVYPYKTDFLNFMRRLQNTGDRIQQINTIAGDFYSISCL